MAWGLFRVSFSVIYIVYLGDCLGLSNGKAKKAENSGEAEQQRSRKAEAKKQGTAEKRRSREKRKSKKQRQKS